MDASSNFWGTTNSQEIAAMVLDSSDSIQYKSAISTANALFSADPNTPSVSTTLVADSYLAAEALAEAIVAANAAAANAAAANAAATNAAAKAEATKQESVAKKQEAADQKREAATKRVEQEKMEEDDLELDGETEEPSGDVSVNFKASTKKYLVSISSNLEEENLVLRATKKGSKTLQYKVITNTEGNVRFSTRNILKGFTMTLLFNGERLDSFRIK
jgi:hypothetical protein